MINFYHLCYWLQHKYNYQVGCQETCKMTGRQAGRQSSRMKIRPLTSGWSLVQPWSSNTFDLHIWDVKCRAVCCGYKLQHHHCCCHRSRERERERGSVEVQYKTIFFCLLCGLSFSAPAYWFVSPSLSLSLTISLWHLNIIPACDGALA